MQEIRHIVLIGAGNVGSHLGKVLKKQGMEILQVFSRTEAHASSLAKLLQSEHTTDPTAIRPDGDLYILAVRDTALEQLLHQRIVQDRFLVHTSGALPMEVLASASDDFGVLYPLQTFSVDREVRFESVPLCIEASSDKNLVLLESLANKISRVVRRIDSRQRKALHLAAVFACNFPNYMYIEAERWIARSGLDFNLLKPLILETALKVQTMEPLYAQTGPAIRGDDVVLRNHLDLLKNQPELQNLYREISTEISKLKKILEQGSNDE